MGGKDTLSWKMRIYDTNRSVEDADEMFLRVTASNIVHGDYRRRLENRVSKEFSETN